MLIIQKNAIEDSEIAEQIKVEKTEEIDKKMQELRDQMEKIKEVREKIESNTKEEKSKESSSKFNSNGDEIREDIIICASLNEEINAISSTHRKY